MDKVESNFGFSLMSLSYKFRDLLAPRKNVLKEVEIKPGFAVLDYGCGPGGYVIATAELVGKSGKIYALDIHPLAIQMVQSIASKKQLANVQTICSDCKTGLPDSSIDVVLLYDTLHALGDSNGVLAELHRVLKPSGILSFSDHHLKEEEIISVVTGNGLFNLSRKDERTYSFVRDEGES
ncbi:class I SAM-dependent methyltransferase [Chloroflexota bacterium]